MRVRIAISDGYLYTNYTAVFVNDKYVYHYFTDKKKDRNDGTRKNRKN